MTWENGCRSPKSQMDANDSAGNILRDVCLLAQLRCKARPEETGGAPGTGKS